MLSVGYLCLNAVARIQSLNPCAYRMPRESAKLRQNERSGGGASGGATISQPVPVLVCPNGHATAMSAGAQHRLDLNRAGSTVPTTPRRGAPAPLGDALTLPLPLRVLCSALAPAQKIRDRGV